MLDVLHYYIQSNNGIGQTDIDREIRIFPDEGSEDVISCLCLTPEFLIYGTDVSYIIIYLIMLCSYNLHRIYTI